MIFQTQLSNIPLPTCKSNLQFITNETIKLWSSRIRKRSAFGEKQNKTMKILPTCIYQNISYVFYVSIFTCLACSGKVTFLEELLKQKQKDNSCYVVKWIQSIQNVEKKSICTNLISKFVYIAITSKLQYLENSSFVNRAALPWSEQTNGEFFNGTATKSNQSGKILINVQ